MAPKIPAPDSGRSSPEQIAIELVDHLDAMLAYWDANQVCLFANDAYRSWFGKRKEEVIGMTMEQLLGPLYKLNQPYILKALAGELQVFERTIPTPLGIRYSLATYTPHKVEGKVLGMFVHVADVTPLKELEQQLQEINGKLEAEVLRRTAELISTNEQLQGFTYSVAHDMRQQIRGINSNARLLLLDSSEDLMPEATHRLQRLVSSANKLASLVDDMLNYARLGKRELNPDFFDLTALAKDLTAFLTDRGGRYRNAEFIIADGMVAYGDELLMTIVMENLLENAITYSGDVERPVIEVGQTDSAFFVRDNGPGFDMRFYNKLFQPFERLHGESDDFGTGIGLASVKRIIERHGGSVWAEGAPGKGSTIYFTLP